MGPATFADVALGGTIFQQTKLEGMIIPTGTKEAELHLSPVVEMPTETGHTHVTVGTGEADLHPYILLEGIPHTHL